MSQASKSFRDGYAQAIADVELLLQDEATEMGKQELTAAQSMVCTGIRHATRLVTEKLGRPGVAVDWRGLLVMWVRFLWKVNGETLAHRLRTDSNDLSPEQNAAIGWVEEEVLR